MRKVIKIEIHKSVKVDLHISESSLPPRLRASVLLPRRAVMTICRWPKVLQYL